MQRITRCAGWLGVAGLVGQRHRGDDCRRHEPELSRRGRNCRGCPGLLTILCPCLCFWYACGCTYMQLQVITKSIKPSAFHHELFFCPFVAD